MEVFGARTSLAQSTPYEHPQQCQAYLNSKGVNDENIKITKIRTRRTFDDRSEDVAEHRNQKSIKNVLRLCALCVTFHAERWLTRFFQENQTHLKLLPSVDDGNFIIHQNHKPMEDQKDPLLNAEDELKAENNLLKLKLGLEHGMKMSETGNLSPDVENQWL